MSFWTYERDRPGAVGDEPVDAPHDLALGDAGAGADRARWTAGARRGSRSRSSSASTSASSTASWPGIGRRPQPSAAQSPIAGTTAITTSRTIDVEIAASARLYV